MLQLTKPRFLKQKNMLRVLYALAPIALVSVYYFGWRILAVLIVSIFFSFMTEWVMVTRRKRKISYACFVTSALYALSLPPTVPFWIVAVGAIIGILFGKEAFGGFGKNVFNPAIVGRAFVYVCFPIALTAKFVPAFRGFPGGFGAWSMTALDQLPPYLRGTGMEAVNAVTAATPMWARRDFGYLTDLGNLFTGIIGDSFSTEGTQRILAAGSAGEVSFVAILLAAIYLLMTKTANWRLMLSPIIGAVALNVLLRNILGIEAVPPPAFTLLSGGFAYAAVYMVTEPVSAPKLPLSQWIYGLFIGAMIVFFRYKAIFAGGVAFSILLGNMIAPSLDMWIKRAKARNIQRGAS
ncbi:MAG: NADH:ubiquinone oxidoreductase, Na translocating, B subunit [Chitinivibrionales bacterium]|nr:NADH:ubiquinone oxidoreductase, Na translocating, B subunit [Chitinivibrionales bacterium]MBD3358023.1 NADH:ubiquinone oxidoreductase, Na translocating, B subunit [Chitinivibrionales bacterium]